MVGHASLEVNSEIAAEAPISLRQGFAMGRRFVPAAAANSGVGKGHIGCRDVCCQPSPAERAGNGFKFGARQKLAEEAQEPSQPNGVAPAAAEHQPGVCQDACCRPQPSAKAGNGFKFGSLKGQNAEAVKTQQSAIKENAKHVACTDVCCQPKPSATAGNGFRFASQSSQSTVIKEAVSIPVSRPVVVNAPNHVINKSPERETIIQINPRVSSLVAGNSIDSRNLLQVHDRPQYRIESAQSSDLHITRVQAHSATNLDNVAPERMGAQKISANYSERIYIRPADIVVGHNSIAQARIQSQAPISNLIDKPQTLVHADQNNNMRAAQVKDAAGANDWQQQNWYRQKREEMAAAQQNKINENLKADLANARSSLEISRRKASPETDLQQREYTRGHLGLSKEAILGAHHKEMSARMVKPNFYEQPRERAVVVNESVELSQKLAKKDAYATERRQDANILKNRAENEDRVTINNTRSVIQSVQSQEIYIKREPPTQQRESNALLSREVRGKSIRSDDRSDVSIRERGARGSYAPKENLLEQVSRRPARLRYKKLVRSKRKEPQPEKKYKKVALKSTRTAAKIHSDKLTAPAEKRLDAQYKSAAKSRSARIVQVAAIVKLKLIQLSRKVAKVAEKPSVIVSQRPEKSKTRNSSLNITASLAEKRLDTQSNSAAKSLSARIVQFVALVKLKLMQHSRRFAKVAEKPSAIVSQKPEMSKLRNSTLNIKYSLLELVPRTKMYLARIIKLIAAPFSQQINKKSSSNLTSTKEISRIQGLRQAFAKFLLDFALNVQAKSKRRRDELEEQLLLQMIEVSLGDASTRREILRRIAKMQNPEIANRIIKKLLEAERLFASKNIAAG